MARLIKRGAEADLYLGSWFGERAVFKVRRPKAYRQPQLDSMLRERRTVHEALSLADARKAGVPSPTVYFVDQKKAKIVMQHIAGPRLKELLDGGERSVEDYCIEIGRDIAKLHKRNIIHGDLTTSNFIVAQDSRVVFIDFGLSFFSPRLEDKAVDLHLIKEALRSAHSNVAEIVFAKVMEGYSQVSGQKSVRDLLAKIREIELRGRYARVE